MRLLLLPREQVAREATLKVERKVVDPVGLVAVLEAPGVPETVVAVVACATILPDLAEASGHWMKQQTPHGSVYFVPTPEGNIKGTL